MRASLGLDQPPPAATAVPADVARPIRAPSLSVPAPAVVVAAPVPVPVSAAAPGVTRGSTTAASAARVHPATATAAVQLPAKRRASSPLRRVSGAWDVDAQQRNVRPHMARPLSPVLEGSPPPVSGRDAAPLRGGGITHAASISSVAGTLASGHTSVTDGSTVQRSKTFHYVEVVRGKAARAALHGFDCACCRDFYESVNNFPLARMQAVVGPDGARIPILRPATAVAAPMAAAPGHAGAALVRTATAVASRHRAQFSPAHTPEGFWDLGSMPELEDLPMRPFNRHDDNR